MFKINSFCLSLAYAHIQRWNINLLNGVCIAIFSDRMQR